MAKSKFLPILILRGSSMKSSSSKKDIANTVPASNESNMIKSQQELLNLLNNLPESESESDRELSFSFLVDSSPEKDDVSEKGGKTEQQCKEATTVKEKKKSRISRSSFDCGRRIGVLLNFHVPVPLPADNRRSRSVRESPCTSLAEIEKREMEFSKFGCWSGLLRRKQYHNELSPEAVPQLTY